MLVDDNGTAKYFICSFHHVFVFQMKVILFRFNFIGKQNIFKQKIIAQND